jgi:hypothetical protein
MKNTLFPVVLGLAILFSIPAVGQTSPEEPPMMKDTTSPKPMLGFRLGANFQTITSSDWVQAYNAGVTGGFFAGFHQKNAGIRLEILASTTQYKSVIPIDSEGNKGNFSVVYLDVPLLFEYNIIPQLSIQLGPQFSSIVSVTKQTTLDADPKVLFKSSEFSGVVGLEAKLPAHIIAGARYIYGFTNLNNSALVSSENWETRTIQVYAGYIIKQ